MSATASVELPASQQTNGKPHENGKALSPNDPTIHKNHPKEAAANTSTPTAEALAGTPVQNFSEKEHTQTTSMPTSPEAALSSTSSPSKTDKSTTRTTVPAVPTIPAMPKVAAKEGPSTPPKTAAAVPPASGQLNGSAHPSAETAQVRPETEPAPVQTTKAAPILWSNLLKSPKPATAPSSSLNTSGSAAPASIAPIP
ncbi:hypothetical protein O1611_g9103 [Lasiodiplodia mahajangana]|uniref:Uncharacterized protein n=1 Tax=Lasiodiplodia mahajangana TaxID=1108764 RepID=A0ACC2JAZ0_9PEZI|nr:hypothetical protein O1611_g9103 [Lasiodiplodia mahajangana]